MYTANHCRTFNWIFNSCLTSTIPQFPDESDRVSTKRAMRIGFAGDMTYMYTAVIVCQTFELISLDFFNYIFQPPSCLCVFQSCSSFFRAARICPFSHSHIYCLTYLLNVTELLWVWKYNEDDGDDIVCFPTLAILK